MVAATLVQFVPIIAIGQMPFMFGDARKGTAALDSWYRKYAASEMKDTHFCFAFIHDPGALHSRKKIVLPQDLRGAKVRPAQSTIAELVTKLGGTNVQASAPEAREVLQMDETHPSDAEHSGAHTPFDRSRHLYSPAG